MSIDRSPQAAGSDRVVAGPVFAPLEARYEQIRAGLQARPWPRQGVPEILVSFGAWDRTNRTGIAVDAVSSLTPDASLAVALAREAPNFAAIAQQVRPLPGCRLIENCRDMTDLYVGPMLGIGAPGMSQFERACCGLPTVLVCQNDTYIQSACTRNEPNCSSRMH